MRSRDRRRQARVRGGRRRSADQLAGVVAAVGVLVVVVAAVAAPAAAHPRLPVDPAGPLDVSYAATDNVEFLGRFPEHAGTAGGRLVGDRFYLTDPRGVYVYDVSVPEAPELLGSLALPQGGTFAALAQEDPDTDGHVLLVDAIDPTSGSPSAGLKVVDVSDPTALRVLGSAPVGDHTWTCVSTPTNGCAYAYGRTGYIVDVTDPAAPKLLNDLVVDYHTFGYHSVEWPNEGRDHILVAGTEIAPDGALNLAGSDCQGEGSWITTYDARSVAKADRIAERSGNTRQVERASFEALDHYHVAERGIFLDGDAPAHTLYCAHWMELAPDFDGGGRMVVAYYDWGTRFVDVAPDGTMSEQGWFVPSEGYAGSAQWITEEVVYVMDYRRGLEVLRLHDRPATGRVVGGLDLVMAGSATQMDGIVHRMAEHPGLALFAVGLALVALDRRRASRCATAAPHPRP
jgi:hypothetical protein